MESLYGMSPAELAGACGISPAFRARQIHRWLARGALSFAEMTDLSLAERERLRTLFPRIASSEPAAEFADPDGSVKLQIRLGDGAAAECVLLEDVEGRKTACLSSQVGCPIGCAFCKTGSLGYLRDLSAGEIMEQFHFLAARRDREAPGRDGAERDRAGREGLISIRSSFAATIPPIPPPRTRTIFPAIKASTIMFAIATILRYARLLSRLQCACLANFVYRFKALIHDEPDEPQRRDRINPPPAY